MTYIKIAFYDFDLWALNIPQHSGQLCHMYKALVIPCWAIPQSCVCSEHPWDFPSKNTEVGCHAFLQGIFPTQGSNLVSYIASRLFTV